MARTLDALDAALNTHAEGDAQQQGQVGQSPEWPERRAEWEAGAGWKTLAAILAIGTDFRGARGRFEAGAAVECDVQGASGHGPGGRRSPARGAIGRESAG